MYKAQDETLRFTIPEPVAGWSFEYTIRAANNLGAALVTVTSGFTVTSGATSTVDVSLTAVNLDLPETSYAHALWRIGAGVTKPLAVGELLVLSSSHTT